MANFTLHPGIGFEKSVDWLNQNLDSFFDGISNSVMILIEKLESIFTTGHPLIMIGLLALFALYVRGWKKWGLALFAVLGFLLIYAMELWDYTMQTLALVLVSSFLTLIIGVPLGILSGRNDHAKMIIRPCLDFMQTMPAFVYLIPAVLFFQLGKVPGVMATVIFSMPPAVRLTSLGLRQVPEEVMEATRSYGATAFQQLFKVQLPIAMKSVLAGVNQTIMLSLSMVVIAAMIGAGGLGDQVLKGITQLKIGLGFESGLAVVVLAIYLDRVTQALGTKWSKV
ncbi:MAG: ABC transporter permease [Phycisphaerae bacterium]|jgi:glycine betaine/proline transport system permease protein